MKLQRPSFNALYKDMSKNPIRPSSQILTNLTRKIIPSLLHSRNLPMPVHAPNILTTTPTWISQGSLAALGW